MKKNKGKVSNYSSINSISSTSSLETHFFSLFVLLHLISRRLLKSKYVNRHLNIFLLISYSQHRNFQQNIPNVCLLCPIQQWFQLTCTRTKLDLSFQSVAIDQLLQFLFFSVFFLTGKQNFSLYIHDNNNNNNNDNKARTRVRKYVIVGRFATAAFLLAPLVTSHPRWVGFGTHTWACAKSNMADVQCRARACICKMGWWVGRGYGG